MTAPDAGRIGNARRGQVSGGFRGRPSPGTSLTMTGQRPGPAQCSRAGPVQLGRGPGGRPSSTPSSHETCAPVDNAEPPITMPIGGHRAEHGAPRRGWRGARRELSTGARRTVGGDLTRVGSACSRDLPTPSTVEPRCPQEGAGRRPRSPCRGRLWTARCPFGDGAGLGPPPRRRSAHGAHGWPVDLPVDGLRASTQVTVQENDHDRSGCRSEWYSPAVDICPAGGAGDSRRAQHRPCMVSDRARHGARGGAPR